MMKQVFTAENLKLTALLTIDFDNYIETVERAHEVYF